MKYFLYTITTLFILFSCTQEKTFEKKDLVSDTLKIDSAKKVSAVYIPLPEYCKIDTGRLKEKYEKRICFTREASKYPVIKGPGDWRAINQIIKDSVDHFIEEVRQNTECDEDPEAPKYMGWANTDFEVLNNDSNYVCIKLDVWSGYGGGNMWIPASRVFIIDSKKRTILSSNIFTEKLNRQAVNESIYTFFKEVHPADVDEYIGHNFVKKDEDLKTFEYGIQRDSLVAAFPVYLSSHASYTVYTVPLKRLKND